MGERISAIVTGYNYGRFIGEAIESVLQQTCPPDEIIVVDDGSTDDTPDVVARFAGAGVRYLRRERGGASAARNTGLLESRGELIAFLDGDDRWLPDKLALQLDHLRLHPSVGLVTGGEWLVFEDGRPPWRHDRPAMGARLLGDAILIENCLGNPSVVLARRSCFDRVGLFDEAIPLGQDWDMWIRIAQVFPVGCVAARLILFRRHSGSMTARRMGDRFAANHRLYRRFIGPVHPFWRRLRLFLAAESMNCYFAATELADQPTWHPATLPFALTAVLLDPAYKAGPKLTLIARVVLGRGVLRRLRSVALRGRAGPGARQL